MKKVLIIEDDAVFRAALANSLAADYQTVSAASGREGLLLVLDEKPDLVLVDLNMPEINGFEVCRRLRQQPVTRNIPIIMVTGSAEVDSTVRGLEVGADDYLCKPFNTRELIARIRARLRRHDSDSVSQDGIQLGNLNLDVKAAKVFLDGKPVSLTQAELNLLRYFLEHPNELISRERLLGDLWPDSVVANRTIDTHVAHIRKKLKLASFQLKTVFRAGYILETGEPQVTLPKAPIS